MSQDGWNPPGGGGGGGGAGTVTTDGITIQGSGATGSPVALKQVFTQASMVGTGLPSSPLGLAAGASTVTSPVPPSDLVFLLCSPLQGDGSLVYDSITAGLVNQWLDSYNPISASFDRKAGSITYDSTRQMVSFGDQAFADSENSWSFATNSGGWAGFSLFGLIEVDPVGGSLPGFCCVANWANSAGNPQFLIQSGTPLQFNIGDFQGSFFFNNTFSAGINLGVQFAFMLTVDTTGAATMRNALVGGAWSTAATGAFRGTGPSTGVMEIHSLVGQPGTYGRGVLYMSNFGMCMHNVVANSQEEANLLAFLMSKRPPASYTTGIVGDPLANQQAVNQLRAARRAASPVIDLEDLPPEEHVPVSSVPANSFVDCTVQLRHAAWKYGHIRLGNATKYQAGLNYTGAFTHYSQFVYYVSSPVEVRGLGSFEGRTSRLQAADFSANIYGLDKTKYALPVLVCGSTNGAAQSPSKTTIKSINIEGNWGTNPYGTGILLYNSPRCTFDECGVEHANVGMFLTELGYMDVREMFAINCNVCFIYGGYNDGVDFADNGMAVAWANYILGHAWFGMTFLGQSGSYDINSPYVFKNKWAKFGDTPFATLSSHDMTALDGSALPSFTPGPKFLKVRQISSENSCAGKDGENSYRSLVIPYPVTGGANWNASTPPYWSAGTTYGFKDVVSAYDLREDLTSEDQRSGAPEQWISVSAGNVGNHPSTQSTKWVRNLTFQLLVNKQFKSCLFFNDQGFNVDLDDTDWYDPYPGIVLDGEPNSNFVLGDNFHVPGNKAFYGFRAYDVTATAFFRGRLTATPGINYILENLTQRPNAWEPNSAGGLQIGGAVIFSSFPDGKYAGEFAAFAPGLQLPISASPWTNPTGLPAQVTVVGAATLTVGSGVSFANTGQPVLVPAGSALTFSAGTATYALPAGSIYSPIGSQGNALPNRLSPKFTAKGSHTSVTYQGDGGANGVTGGGMSLPPWSPSGTAGIFRISQISFGVGAAPATDWAYTPFVAGGAGQTNFNDGDQQNIVFVRLCLTTAGPVRIKIGMCANAASSNAPLASAPWSYMAGCLPANDTDTRTITPTSGSTFTNPGSGIGPDSYPVLVTISGGTGVVANGVAANGSGSNLYTQGKQYAGSGVGGANVPVTAPTTFCLGTGQASIDDYCAAIKITYATAPTVTWKPALPTAVTLYQNVPMVCGVLWKGGTDGQFVVSPAGTLTVAATIQAAQLGYGRKDGVSKMMRDGLWW